MAKEAGHWFRKIPAPKGCEADYCVDCQKDMCKDDPFDMKAYGLNLYLKNGLMCRDG